MDSILTVTFSLMVNLKQQDSYHSRILNLHVNKHEKENTTKKKTERGNLEEIGRRNKTK